MSEEQLSRSRRFALTVGLLLITYVLAGITMEPGSKIEPLGIPFVIARTELLPIGLAFASFYSGLRFWYYGILLAESPAARRRSLIKRLAEASSDPSAEKIVSPEDEQVIELMKQAPRAFPRIPGAAITLKTQEVDVPGWRTSRGDKSEESVRTRAVVGFDVPRSIHVAAFLEMVDYTAPIWVNAGAVVIYLASLLTEKFL